MKRKVKLDIHAGSVKNRNAGSLGNRSQHVRSSVENHRNKSRFRMQIFIFRWHLFAAVKTYYVKYDC
jgi:hypothetical protein